jgi:hypothetical protein
MNRTVDMYEGFLETISTGAAGSPPDLHEIDLDTGKPSRLGEYRLADEAYGKLLAVLVNQPQGGIPPDVQRSLVDFYEVRTEPEWYARKPKEWRRLAANLERLDALPKPIPAAVASAR